MDLMQCMLRRVRSWCSRTGLSVNPDKTELVIFTRKHEVGDFRAPIFGGKRLEMRDSVKYLGVTLDRKLRWGTHLENQVRRFHSAFWLCRAAFGSTWGLRPKVVVWLLKQCYYQGSHMPP